MRGYWTALCGALATAVACSEITEPPSPTITGVTVGATGPLLRSLSVQLDRPGSVAVNYAAAPGTPLQVVSVAAVEEHDLLLPRLRSETRYVYEVRTEADRFAGEFMTGSLPDDLAAIQFVSSGTPTMPLALLEIISPEGFKGFVIVDDAGQVVWYFRTEGAATGSTRRSNGNFVFLDLDIGLIEVGPDGSVVAELPQDTVTRNIHNDVIVGPQNTLLFLALDRQLVNDTLIAGEAIWEWTPETGVERKVWSSFDHLSTTADWGPRSRVADWLHANSLSIGPRNNVLVSFNFLNQIVSLAADYGSFEWRLGGTNATIEVTDNDRFSGQHTAAEISEGHVLMFDNGVERTEPYSRALELELNGAAARKTWEFRPTPDNWSRFISSARRLPNGNTFVAFGMSEVIGSTGPIEVYEVNLDLEIQWHLVVSGRVSFMYRATPLPGIGGEISAN